MALTVWESECLVGGCNGVVVQKGLPNAEGYPSFTLNAYCVDHKQGGSKAAAGYDATFKRMQADYDAATPEEKARIDAKKAALVERARQREIVRRTAYRIEAQDASLPEQRKRWERQLRMAVECGAKTVEALARKRGRSAADTQKRIAESRIRIERKWVREWDAAHPEAPFYHGPDYAGPSTTAVVHSPCQAHLRPPPVSAPPVSAPAPAQDAVARAEREYSAVFRVLSANATGATLENLDPEYKAILTWAANQANGAPVFDRISSNKPTEADASAIVALFERLPMAPTLEWEGAWRMAHRLGHLYTDPQRRNREGVRVTGLEDAFNAAFGWQPGHNCYHSQTEDKLLAKALHESRAQLVKASATLDRVREQMEELPLLALMEDVAQVEADLVAQEIEAQESLERIQRQRERMLRRKAERDLDDATQKALREKHKEPDCPIPAYLYQRGAGQDSDYNP